MTDDVEIAQGTDPGAADDVLDTDGDRVPDAVESIDGTDASDPALRLDSDTDGAPDWVERRLGANPLRTDSDGDQASDGEELSAGTVPTDRYSHVDGDGDEVPPSVEVEQGTDPADGDDVLDGDGDGVPDYVEGLDGTDPADRGIMLDTDGDGLSTTEMARVFAASWEFELLYGAMHNTRFVESTYSNVLCRAPDRDGLIYWAGQLARAGISRSDLVVHLLASRESGALTPP